MAQGVRRQAGDLLFLLGALTALSFLAAPNVAASARGLIFPEGPAWKAAGIATLGLYALTRRSWFACGALFASSVGDILLELAPPRMAAGMGAFAVAHLFYLAAFARRLRQSGRAPTAWLALPVLVVSLILLVWFYPGMGSLRAPGLIYHAVITAMALTALISRAPWAAKLGAVIFMLSDTLIALGLYNGTPAPSGSVWLTYAVAQILLARSLSEPARARVRPLAGAEEG